MHSNHVVLGFSFVLLNGLHHEVVEEAIKLLCVILIFTLLDKFSEYFITPLMLHFEFFHVGEAFDNGYH